MQSIKCESTQKGQIINQANIEVTKILISYMTISESIVFENINKNKVRLPFKKLIAKHQRNLIINAGLTRVERLRLWYNKT